MTLALARRTPRPVPPDALFQGALPVWANLEPAERLVALGAALLPLWWCIGLNWCLALLNLTCVWVAVRFHRRERNRGLPFTGLALFAFGVYVFVNGLLHRDDPSPSALFNPINLWFTAALALWVAESRRVRVRLPVLGWACAVLVGEAVALWGFCCFVLGEPPYAPLRTLLSVVLDRSERFVPGAGNANYLSPYESGERGLWGFGRYGFFFGGPTQAAVIGSAVLLVALDLRHRLAWLLVAGAAFLVLLSQTRAAWVLLPLLLVLRLFLYAGQRSRALLCGLLAALSFLLLAVPPVTDAVVSKVDETVGALNDFHRGSSDVRLLIYTRTLDLVPEQLWFGHGINGPTVLPGFDPARIGSHSFLLGTLLYKNGLVGTVLFLGFAGGYGAWLWRTRQGRPLACLLVPLLVLSNGAFEEFEAVQMLPLLVVPLLSNAPASGAPASGHRRATQ
jgi:hypothetical protein